MRVILASLAFLVCLAPARADEAGVKTTALYVQKLQTKSGGFLPRAPTSSVAAPTLRATSSAIRTLHYLKASIPNKEACVKFVADCHDAQSGGFADMPAGKPDVFSTAVGLMAVRALMMPVDRYGPGAVKFLTENARSFEEIRIAAAGLESIEEKAPRAQAWLEEIAKMRNADGTFGQDAGQARDTGSGAVTILRLGGTLKDKALVLKVLREGQRLSGGYGKGDNELAADLETTYRVMRCFMMLKAQPDRVEGLRTFVAKCRNEDGGYGVAPGEPSTVGGAYFATIIRYWQGEKP
jgi:prenyltransferase beta subunit